MSDLSIRLGKNAAPVVGTLRAKALPVGSRANTMVMDLTYLNDDIDSDMWDFDISFNFKTKEYKHSDLIILTSNLKSANIVGCLDLTPYVYYLRSKVESIAFKIIKIGNTKRTQPIKFQ